MDPEEQDPRANTARLSGPRDPSRRLWLTSTRGAILIALLLASGCGARFDADPSDMGRLQGTVRDEKARPIGRALVEALSLDDQPVPDIAIRSGADGTYEWIPLHPGDYEIVVSARGFEKQTKSVQLEAEEATTVDFVLQKEPRPKS